MNRTARFFFVAAGTAAVAVGFVAMVVPLLPTTPFLLLAAYCYSRSSPRFHRWLLTNRLVGAYIDNYRSGRGMAVRDKVATLATLWGTICLTGAIAATSWWGRLLLIAIAVGVTVHIVRLRTHRPGRSPAMTGRLRRSDEIAGRVD